MRAPAAPAVALSAELRRAELARLGEHPLDVLVVGGGIVGAGAALDAATRGLAVAVVEAQDWASGTSSRSSKLIHGGLRYLQMFDFALVREALRERSTLLRIAPHLVRPVPILYPLRHRVVERAYVGAGVLLYDLLARGGGAGGGVGGGVGRDFPFHRQLSRRRARQLAPALSPRYVGAIQYYDGQVDDARYTLSVLRTAVGHGATALSRMLAVALLADGERVRGARLRDTETGEEREVQAKVVVSATGVWTERFEALTGRHRAMRVQPSKGIHLVVPRDRIEASRALILPTEKSVLFVLPWGAHWVVGTTDTPWHHDLARPAATAADVDYLLATLNGALTRPLGRSDVEAVYVGLRPLIAGGDDETTKLSREHAVNRPQPGLVLISGGKYTTYRVMAKDVIDAAVEHAGLSAGPSRSADTLIVGAEGFSSAGSAAAAAASAAGVDPGQLDRLLARYGSLIGELLAPAATDRALSATLPGSGGYLGAEIAYAVTHEDARHLDDVLERRTRIAIETADRGLAAAGPATAIMAPLLGWDGDAAEAEVAAYRAQVEAARAGEAEPDDERAAARLAAAAPPLELP